MDRHAAHNRPLASPMVLPGVLVVMGVSGSGKTTVGKRLAGRLGWHYQEGDALHPPENVAKMSAGTPLGDADRIPWLQLIARRMAARKGHFMPTALLDNQFATLQEPSPDERAIVVDVGGTPNQIVDEVLRRMPPNLKREPA